MSTEQQKFLQERILGQVLWNEDILRFYSVDASSYQIIPEVVIIPKNQKDVVTAVKFAKKTQKSITARGAGTGLVGNSLNDGIILDMSNLDSVKIKRDSVVVGPGTRKGELDKILQKHGKFFPPNPSIGRYCSVGGMLGNNSSGSRSLKYGNTIDNVLEITFVDGNGDMITLPQDSKVGKKILALAKKVNWAKIPNTTKNSSGYRIDGVMSIGDTQKVIVGSEGTLGIIVSAELKIRDIPKKRTLYIIEYDLPKNAAEDCPRILKSKPAAVEFVDVQTLKHFDVKLARDVACMLFVEYDSGLAGAEKKISRAITGRIRQKINSEKEIQKWWKMRDMSLHYSLKLTNPKGMIPQVIEDATVPVKNLAGLFKIIRKLNEKFNTNTIMYGHAGSGNIHLRLQADRQTQDIKEIATYYFNQILKLGGSTSGEHGDGLARTWFVRYQYGQENYEIFEQLKSTLDPHNILNPGKIISKTG